MARRRREQGTVRGAKLRPRDLATEDLDLVAKDEQLDVLDVQATATANKCPQQSPERHVEKREGHRADPPNPAREGRDTSIGALHARGAPALWSSASRRCLRRRGGWCVRRAVACDLPSGIRYASGQAPGEFAHSSDVRVESREVVYELAGQPRVAALAVSTTS
jgi:hypothetical protein